MGVDQTDVDRPWASEFTKEFVRLRMEIEDVVFPALVVLLFPLDHLCVKIQLGSQFGRNWMRT